MCEYQRLSRTSELGFFGGYTLDQDLEHAKGGNGERVKAGRIRGKGYWKGNEGFSEPFRY